MKKCTVIVLILCVSLGLCSCGKSKTEKIIEAINKLPQEITLNHEQRVDKINEKYSGLTDEEKDEIINYEVLESANNKISFYKHRKETIESAPLTVREYIKGRLKVPSSFNVIETEVIPSKERSNEAFVRMQYTAANSYGGVLEETCFVKVELFGKEVDLNCTHFGDAHEEWEDVDWSDDVMEEIDFEYK